MSASMRERTYTLNWVPGVEWTVIGRGPKGVHLNSTVLVTTVWVPESELIVTAAGSPLADGHRGGGGVEAHGAPVAPPAASSPRARTTDPDTAWHAANKARTHATENRIRCLIAHRDAGDAGLTGEQLADATGLAYEVIGPRRPWLETNGFVVRLAGITRPNRRGNPEGVYVITAAGRLMADKLEAEAVA